MQLTTPIEPAMAVSTAINTLSNLLQSTFLDIVYFFIVRHHIFVHRGEIFTTNGHESSQIPHAEVVILSETKDLAVSHENVFIVPARDFSLCSK